MRPIPIRDRFQLAAAPQHVHVLVTLFSGLAALALLLELIHQLMQSGFIGPASTAGAAPFGLRQAARTLLEIGLLFFVQSALVATTSLPARTKTMFYGAAFAAAALIAAAPLLVGSVLPELPVLSLVATALAALAGWSGAALVVREAWFVTPLAAVERETVWPERGRAPGTDSVAREGRGGRDRPRRGPRSEGNPRPPRPAGETPRATENASLSPMRSGPGAPENGLAGDRESRDADARRRKGRGSRRRSGARPGRSDGELRPGAPAPPAVPVTQGE